MRRLMALVGSVLVACSVEAEVYKFDIGSETSPVQEGFTRLVAGAPAGESGAAFRPVTSWADYEYFEMSIFTECSRTNLPKVPLGITLYMPDRAHAFSYSLCELRTGQWTTVKIPLSKMVNPAQCTEISFALSESMYSDGDKVDFWIDRIVLTGGKGGEKALVLDDGSEKAASLWNAVESTCSADGRHVMTGKTALRFHVDIDWKAGEAKYPVGWPRMNRSVPGGISVRDRAFDKYVDNDGRQVPPPVWTCPLTQDSAVGDRPAVFTAQVKPGRYNAWVLCGVSDYRRPQYFDFDVTSGIVKRRVQFENAWQYREVYIPVDARDGVARLQIAPHSRYAVCGIVLWPDEEAEIVKREVIEPVRQYIDFLPPDEAMKWVDDTPQPSGDRTIEEREGRERGYVVFQKHWAECVYAHTVPYAEDLNPVLKAFATQGEYEPLTFTVHPLRSFAKVDVTVSALRCGLFRTIPASAIEVRRVKYMKARPNYTVLHAYREVPDVLMPYAPGPLADGENATFWLTVHVPANAKTGMYRGSVMVAPAGGKTMDIPIVFRVLPFRLEDDPDKIYGIYYHDPLDDWNRAGDEVSRAYYLRKSGWALQDMVEHGTRNVTSSFSCAPEQPGKPGVFKFNSELMEAKVAAWRKHGFKAPVVVSVSAESVYAKYAGSRPGSHLKGAKAPPPEYGEELTRMCKAIESERVKRGWPEFLYYPVDEPSVEPDAIAFMVETLKAVRNAGVKTYVTADPTNEGFAPLRPYVDVWCTQPYLPLREAIIADKAARKVDYWCYPNHVNGENDHTPVNGARMTYGFGFWRSGFTTLIPWIYSADSGSPWNYLDGSAMDFFNRFDDTGRPIPVAMWEAYREGYDDYRYIYTLQKFIAKAAGGNARQQAAAKEAQADLDFIWQKIRVQAKYKNDDLWAPRELDAYRWLIAQNILKLRTLE